MFKLAKKTLATWLLWSMATLMLLAAAYPIVVKQQPRTPNHLSAPATYSH